ncbi:TetR/AcrR family transcriptional regulator [Arthrobacter sp. 35W]|uniref:TetR/AcrR family transcriptional regulator n=1 Tax=Arthrobacter sp. 35W TaxID=1132441 RepID=UPI0004062DD8|nr:TetR/AcrR family transcriptional regulator [Arthrobacter sp. 35W]
MSDLRLIPLQGPSAPTGLRGDALRNRELLLNAAVDIISREGADALTMDGLAQAAGVGKGTVFRHFGSRSGLMLELLTHSETEFQRGFLSGPPPLGPGAEPAERLKAFGRAAVNRFRMVGDLQLAATAGDHSPYAVPAFHLLRQHVAMLLRAGGATGDIELLAYTLLGTLTPSALAHHLNDQRLDPERITAHWNFLVDAILPPMPSTTATTP